MHKKLLIVTVLQRSWLKLIFSLTSVCSHGGLHVTITHDALDLTEQGHPWTLDLRDAILPSPGPLLVTSRGHHRGSLQTYSFEDHPPALTSGGQNSYDWQAGGTHLTTELSCIKLFHTAIKELLPRNLIMNFVNNIIRIKKVIASLNCEYAIHEKKWLSIRYEIRFLQDLLNVQANCLYLFSNIRH